MAAHRASLAAVLAGALLAAVFWPVRGIPASAQTGMKRVLPQSGSQVLLSYAPVVRRVKPAVVNIYAARKVEVRSPLFGDPFFRQFLGRDFAFGLPRERIERSLGSGVLVKENGIVVTNNHVVGGAQVIRVVLADRREFDARVLLADRRTDLAVLRLKAPEGTRFPTAPLGDSDRAEVGDIVLAIGNPFGIGQTVTAGIVSATARTNIGINDFGFFSQTDAAINPCNSGGALVGLDGRLLGINSAIFSRTGQSSGIGFAIPVNMVKVVLSAAMEGGELVRTWLGASYQPVTPDIAEALGLDRPGGVILREIVPDGPAARAGLQVGDVLLAIDGHEVIDVAALRFRLATHRDGDLATVEVLRDGRRLKKAVRLEVLPDGPAHEPLTLTGRHPFQGVTFAELTPRLDDRLGLDPLAHGVVVLKVSPRSPAGRIGFLKPGDILLGVLDRPVRSLADLGDLDETEWDRWSFRLRRQGRELACVVFRNGAVDCRME